MPRAIEIRVDEKSQGVVIDTNFPNREVQGATWEPQLFRLGWDLPEDIWDAMYEAVPTLICNRLRLIGEQYPFTLTQAFGETDILLRAWSESEQRGARLIGEGASGILRSMRRMSSEIANALCREIS
jgi:hypothetical protein